MTRTAPHLHIFSNRGPRKPTPVEVYRFVRRSLLSGLKNGRIKGEQARRNTLFCLSQLRADAGLSKAA